jgi:hypothetical protein
LAYSYEQILRAQYEVAEAENASASAALEDARLREDPNDVQLAVDRLVANNNTITQLNQAAMTMQRQQQPQRQPAGFGDDIRRDHVELARQYGLDANEIGVAVGWTSDPMMSDEVKVKRYCENKHRLRQMRADGSYRDDQGRR